MLYISIKMATTKFQKSSPYVEAPPPPREDTKFAENIRNLRLTDPPSSTVHGFALFGVGRAGTLHLSFLVRQPRVELLYIVEDDKSKWEKLKKYWNLVSVKFLTCSQADVVYKDPKVRAVVIATPTFAHEEIVKQALDHGKGVFCEKPVAETYDQTRACYERAKVVNQPLLSAFNRRFDPSFATIKQRVRNGEVGKVTTVKVCSRDSPIPSIEYLENSGRIFHDCAVHDIDMVLYILGEYPTKVVAMASSNIPEIAAINDFDTVTITLSFESGAFGIIDLNRYCIYGYDQRLEVFGQEGMMKAENQLPIHNVETYKETGITKAPIFYSFPSRYADGYELEMIHFLDVLEGKTDLCIDSKDTLAVTRIATACEESVRTGRVVELKWSTEELPSTHF